MSCLIGYELVTYEFEPDGNDNQKVDLTIPSGKNVTGSGVIATHYWFAGWDLALGRQVEEWREFEYTSDFNSSFASAMDGKAVTSGPHPTDSSKWRFQIGGSGSLRVKLKLWVACIG